MGKLIGGIIGFAFGFIVWFPYGIMYAVQANSDSYLVQIIATLKGLLEL